MAVAAAASLAILPEVAAVDTPNSGFSALSPGIIVWIAITGSVSLLETVAARVAHALSAGPLSYVPPLKTKKPHGPCVGARAISAARVR